MAHLEISSITQDMVDLTTKEGVLRIAEDKVLVENPNYPFSLVFYLYTVKPFNEENFIKKMKEQWDLSQRERIETITQNLFVVRFRNQPNFERVRSQGSWLFQNNLTLFVEWDLRQSMQRLDFHLVELWVQFHILPLRFHTEEIAKDFAAILGNS